MTQALVICGDGVNCENETALAFEKAGANSKIVHINDLLKNEKILKDYQILAFPGGFSFGDYLGSAKVLGLKLKNQLESPLKEFATKGLILGVCNGFQLLVKMGLLPYPDMQQRVSLAPNIQGSFMDKWSELNITDSHCVWTNKLQGQQISLPIRHGEGRFYTDDETLKKLKEENLIALRYQTDENGSLDQIAGITDPSGHIFGLMPHPEAAFFKETFYKHGETGDESYMGKKIFENAINYFR